MSRQTVVLEAALRARIRGEALPDLYSRAEALPEDVSEETASEWVESLPAHFFVDSVGAGIAGSARRPIGAPSSEFDASNIETLAYRDDS